MPAERCSQEEWWEPSDKGGKGCKGRKGDKGAKGHKGHGKGRGKGRAKAKSKGKGVGKSKSKLSPPRTDGETQLPSQRAAPEEFRKWQQENPVVEGPPKPEHSERRPPERPTPAWMKDL